MDQPSRTLLWAAIERGDYTDTTHLTELGRGAAYEKIDLAARASGARVVLGTGIVPDISNGPTASKVLALATIRPLTVVNERSGMRATLFAAYCALSQRLSQFGP